MSESQTDDLDPSISSPCIGVCKLNRHHVCVGCGRSIEQIARWQQYSRAERRRIMNELAAAGQARPAAPPEPPPAYADATENDITQDHPPSSKLSPTVSGENRSL